MLFIFDFRHFCLKARSVSCKQKTEKGSIFRAIFRSFLKKLHIYKVEKLKFKFRTPPIQLNEKLIDAKQV